MHKYYIVTEELATTLCTIDYAKIEYLTTHSAIIHTELTLSELEEHLRKLEPKIPY